MDMTTATVTTARSRRDDAQLEAAVGPLVSILTAFGIVLGAIAGLAIGQLLLGAGVGATVGIAAGVVAAGGARFALRLAR